MAKCVRCQKGIGLFNKGVKINWDEMLCTKCLDELGFSTDDVKADFGRSAAYFIQGKAAAEQAKEKARAALDAYREYKTYVAGVKYENEGGKKIQKILASILKEYADEQYEGYTNKEIADEFYDGDRVYRYPTQELTAELVETTFDGEPAISVYCLEPERVNIGWVPKDEIERVQKLLASHDCDVDVYINGGDYKELQDGDVEKISGEYYANIIIKYTV